MQSRLWIKNALGGLGLYGMLLGMVYVKLSRVMQITLFMLALAQTSGAMNTVAERFKNPAFDATRPGLALMFDTSTETRDTFLRQLERTRELGAGSVLVTFLGPSETILSSIEWVAAACQRLGLELGVCDFLTSEAEHKGSAQRLIWHMTSVIADQQGAVTNLPLIVEHRDTRCRELARLAVPVHADGVIQAYQIVDLSQATLPTNGEWRIYRFCLTDMDPPVMDSLAGPPLFRHVNQMLATWQSRLPKTYGSTLLWYHFTGVPPGELVWPEDLPKLFLKRSGLSLMRYLPALASVPVGGKETAEYVQKQVTFSVREAWRQRFATPVDELVHEAGLQAGIARETVPVDPEEVALFFERPMFSSAQDAREEGCNRRTAGAARVMARRFVIGRIPMNAVSKAETVPLLSFSWKHEADRLLCLGATRLLLALPEGIPGEDVPYRDLLAGCTYVRRCQLLLQHSEPVADFLVWTDQAVPQCRAWMCDYVSQAMLETAVVKGGCLIFGSERTYSSLIISPGIWQNKENERLLLRFVKQGAHLWLMAENEQVVAANQWVQRGGASVRVWPVDGAVGLAADFSWHAEVLDLQLRFIHHRTPEYEFYFVINDSDEAGPVTCTFRDTGTGVPMRWDPVEGATDLEVQGAVRRLDGCVEAPLFMAPHDACFIVFERSISTN